jgi:hypothetical protein
LGSSKGTIVLQIGQRRIFGFACDITTPEYLFIPDNYSMTRATTS